jgi:hypothetical protein
MRFLKWLDRALQSGAALVAIIPLAIGALTALIGFFGGFLLPATAVLLAISLVANAYLLVRYRAALRRIEKVSKALSAIHELASAPLGSEGGVFEWLETPDDLTTLTLSEERLEHLLSRAQEVAGERIASDVVLNFSTLALVPYEWISFDASSEVADCQLSVVVSPGKDRVDLNSVRRGGGFWRSEMPWRIDPAWKDLVRAAGVRERGFVGRVMLDYDTWRGQWPGFSPPEPFPSSQWRIRFAPRQGEVELPERSYGYHAGRLLTEEEVREQIYGYMEADRRRWEGSTEAQGRAP